MISAVIIDGTSVDLDTVAYNVDINVGRTDNTSTYAPSSCRLILYDVVGTSSATRYNGLIGKQLIVRDENSPPRNYFAGFITDVRLTVPTPTSGARVEVIAAGPSIRCALTEVGASGYPAQTVIDRINAIGAELEAAQPNIQIEYLVEANENYTLAAYTGGPINGITALANTVGIAGGFVYDNPAYGVNNGLYVTAQSGGAMGGAFATEFETVLYAPAFTQNGQIINDVTVDYSGGSVTETSTYSASLYGRREARVSTTIDNATQANLLADNIISRSRRPRWNVTGITVLNPSIYQWPTTLRGGFTVANLPSGSPTPDGTWYGVIEGWNHRFENGEHRQTFFLSDRVAAGQAIEWQYVVPSTTYEWNTINSTLIWDNAVALIDFVP